MRKLFCFRSGYNQRLYTLAKVFKIGMSAERLKVFGLKFVEIVAWIQTVASCNSAHFRRNKDHAFLGTVWIIVTLRPVFFCPPFHSLKETAGGRQKYLIRDLHCFL